MRRAGIALLITAFGLTGCGSGRGGGGASGPDAALFSGPLMFVGTQMRIYGTGDMQLADFNDDGLPEFFYEERVGGEDSALHLAPGSETDIFGPETLPGIGENSAIADFDGDGNLDIVSFLYFDTRGSLSYDWSLLRGNGDNTFAEAELLGLVGIADVTTDIAGADINGDGFEDLLSLGYSTGEILPLVNQGNGSFEPAADVQSPSNFGTLYGEDLNLDGFDDILFYYVNGVAIALSNGDGTFGAMVDEIDVSGDVLAAPADMNGDGNVDIAGWSNDEGILAFLGTGDGTFGAALASAVEPALVGADILAVADFNDDTIPDLVITGGRATRRGTAEPVLALAMGIGDGTFSPALQVIDAITSNRALTMDADRDGNLDLLITVTDGAPFLRFYFGNGDGTFREESPALIEMDPEGDLLTNRPRPGNHTTEPFDVDNDGNLDLVIRNSTDSGDLSLLLGNGDGTFSPETRIPLNGVRIDQTIDLDVDNDIDFFGGSAQRYLGILRNYGDADLRTLPLIQISDAPDFSFEGAVDLDADGELDSVYWFFNSDIRVTYGRGNMEFEPIVTVANIGDEFLIGMVDITGDGLLDLVTNQRAGEMDQFIVRPGGPNRTFESAVTSEIPVFPGGSGVILQGGFPHEFADFDGDGRVDMVRFRDQIGNGNGAQRTIVSLLYGQSDGSLQHVQDINVPWIVLSTTVVDLDSDDDLDVFTGSVTLNDLSVFPQQARLFGHSLILNAKGMFELSAGFQAMIGSLFGDVDADAVDVTGEGIPDAVIWSESTGLAIAAGQGDGTFSQPYHFNTGGLTQLVIGDFDNDNDGDVISETTLEGELVVLENRMFRD